MPDPARVKKLILASGGKAQMNVAGSKTALFSETFVAKIYNTGVKSFMKS